MNTKLEEAVEQDNEIRVMVCESHQLSMYVYIMDEKLYMCTLDS